MNKRELINKLQCWKREQRILFMQSANKSQINFTIFYVDELGADEVGILMVTKHPLFDEVKQLENKFIFKLVNNVTKAELEHAFAELLRLCKKDYSNFPWIQQGKMSVDLDFFNRNNVIESSMCLTD